MLPEFPDEIAELKGDLERFCSGRGGRSTVLDREEDFCHVHAMLPRGMTPLMMVDGPGYPDVYALDWRTGTIRVVVWRDDAVVRRWESLRAFKHWIRDYEGAELGR